MSTLAGTDAFVVNRAGVNYQVTAANFMSTVADTDLFVVNRASVNYKVTGLDVKNYLGGSGALVTWESNSVGFTPITTAAALDAVTGNNIGYATFYSAAASSGAMCVICTDGTVRRTTDGATWTTALTGLDVSAGVPTSGAGYAGISVSGDKWVVYNVFGTSANAVRRYSSTDDGATWTTVTGAAARPPGFFAGGDPFDTTGTLWAVPFTGSGTMTSMRKSTDAGATWTNVTTNLVYSNATDSVYGAFVTRSTAGATTILVTAHDTTNSDGEVWATANDGVSWAKVYTYIPSSGSGSTRLVNPLYNGGFVTTSLVRGVSGFASWNFRNATSNAALAGAWGGIATSDSDYPTAPMKLWAAGDPAGSAASSRPHNSGSGFGFTFAPNPIPADQPPISQRLGTA
jgi:hypothetical protein